MIFRNHICFRFLKDDTLLHEIIETQYPVEWEQSLHTTEPHGKIISLYNMLRPDNSKNYFIAETVLEKLDMLKITKKGEHYDWTVFDDRIPEGKYTYIFPDNKLMRMVVQGEDIMFCHCQFTFHPGNKDEGWAEWVMFYLNRKSGELCEHFAHADVKAIEKFYYALLCFLFLTENDEVVIPSGRSYGTRKQGKVMNDLPVAITLVNSRWNTTVVRTEAFGVRGHFRCHRFGPGRGQVKLIFIEPFEKSGYIRRAGKELETKQ